MRQRLKMSLGLIAGLAAPYALVFLAPLPERTTEPIVPPFPAEYGAAAIRDLEAAERLYRQGDLAAARALWTPLAEAGNPEAQFRIGRLYDFGEPVDTDLDEADRRFRRTDEQDHALAPGSHRYLRTNDICDPEFLSLVGRAAELGSRIAQFNLAMLIGVHWQKRSCPRDECRNTLGVDDRWQPIASS